MTISRRLLLVGRLLPKNYRRHPVPLYVVLLTT